MFGIDQSQLWVEIEFVSREESNANICQENNIQLRQCTALCKVAGSLLLSMAVYETCPVIFTRKGCMNIQIAAIQFAK